MSRLLLGCLLFVGPLGGEYPCSQSPEMSLLAVLNEQHQTIEVSLHNTGPHTYLVTMGGHLGQGCSTAFRLRLEGTNGWDGPLILPCGSNVDDSVGGVFEGRLDSWVVLMPGGASYAMSFPLRAIRPMRRLRSSLTDLAKTNWTVRASFTGSLDQNNVLEWQSYHDKADTHYSWNKKTPFWTGTVETTVSHHQSSALVSFLSH